MQPRFLLVLIVFIFCQSGRAQLYYPLENYYQGEIERFALRDSSAIDFYKHHLSSKPILQSRTQPDSIFSSYSKQYYWLTQKLFKENFLIFEGNDFWCAVDPVLDLELGQDLEIDSTNYRYWNTRGIRVQAKFFNKIGFTTTFYENQAKALDYQNQFFNDHGEFYVNGAGTSYNQQNAVIPGYARTKKFKATGYDFAFAQGTVSIEPNRFFNLQFGNGNQFIGDGYRSLLLSDFSTNYPLAKFETNLLKGRIQYSVTYAMLTNLYRLRYFTTPEATYERKLGTFHYFDIAITKNLNLGIFEGAVWKRTDSLGTHQPDWLFTNPIILTNTFIKGESDSAYNSILGLNLSYSFFKNLLYGQLVIDDGNIGAYQIGIKAYDLFISKLDMQVEYNHAEQNAYLVSDRRYNYSHYNLPLAHPYTAGFDEFIVRVSYQYKNWFVENRIVYSARHENDTLNLGTNILAGPSNIALQFLDRTKIFYNQFEIGYRFNKCNNLQAVLGYQFRTDNAPINERVTNYVYIGIRTRLKNKTLDF